MIIRACGSSIRTLINRHLSTAVAATSIQTKTPVSVYSWHYYQANRFVQQSRTCGCGFCSKAAGGGYSAAAAEEGTRGRRKFEAENDLDDDDDDSEVEFDEDDDSDDDDYEDDDDLEMDDH